MRHYNHNTTPRVEICGGIGVGKTTLVKALAEYGFLAVYDPCDQNPHLTEFYKNPAAHAYAKDYWFLEAQQKQLNDINAQSAPAVMDYSLTTSQAFIDAGANTQQDKQKLQGEWQKVRNEVGHPTIVIHMPLSRTEQRARIKSRGREGEDDIPSAYLDSFDAAMQTRMEQLPAGTKIIEIPETMDTKNPETIKNIATQLKRMLAPGRQLGK